MIGQSGIKRSNVAEQRGGRDEPEESKGGGYVLGIGAGYKSERFLRRGGEVSGSSAVTGIPKILFLWQEGGRTSKT